VIAAEDIVGTHDNGSNFVLVPAGQEIPEGVKAPSYDLGTFIDAEAEPQPETKTRTATAEAPKE
jgi:hypothetical protein